MAGSEASLPAAGALAAAIETGLSGVGRPALTARTRRLIAAYRSGEAPAAPVLATRADAAAYAAYRMMATAAAVTVALRETRRVLPAWQPASLLDIGAGTGSAAWAVAGQLPSVALMTLLEQSAEAISIGRAILGATGLGALAAATWRTWRLPEPSQAAERDDVPSADLATLSYVLGELNLAQQAAIVALACRASPAVVVVEPGSSAGHRRILAARARLLGAGYHVAAPCPHDSRCPLEVPGDWCHFGARLPRTAVHRQVKDAVLGYEDEKFSYVAAVRPGLPGSAGQPLDLPEGRIVRRPEQRKGLVTLQVCGRDGMARCELVGKSTGETYRLARKARWGGRWDAPQ